MVYLRNRMTSEYRPVEPDSVEFYGLVKELGSDGRPAWEQTGYHDYAAFLERASKNALNAEDIGDLDQPVEQINAATVAEVDLSFIGQRGYPTEGEKASGLTEEDDRGGDEEFDVHYDRLSEGELLHMVEARGLEAESDDKDDLVAALIAADAGVEDDDDDESDETGTDYTSLSVDELKSEVERRQLEPVGTGTDGNVVKADLISVLLEADANEAQPGA